MGLSKIEVGGAAALGIALAAIYVGCEPTISPYTLTPRRVLCDGQITQLRAPDRIEFEIERRDLQTDVQLFVNAGGEIGEVSGTSKPDLSATEYHPRRVTVNHEGTVHSGGTHFVVDADEPQPSRNRKCVAHIDEVPAVAGRAIKCTPWEG